MPEGDTIHRLARRLAAVMKDREVARFEGRAPKLANAPLEGRLVRDVRARGKHLLMDFEGGWILHSHLRMKGGWSMVRGGRWPRPKRAVDAVLVMDSGATIVGYDLAIAETLRDERRSPLLRSLGPDLLAADFDAAEAALRFRRVGSLPLGDAVMRQNLVAGIGNVYKSELLFLTGLHPLQRVDQTEDAALVALLERGRTLLKRNLRGGPRVTRKRHEGGRLWVYGRKGELCRVCGTPIELVRQGRDLRSTYFCPSCQPRLGEESSAQPVSEGDA
ncbi:MAG: DNA-formamidopyrimidine glycosylase family protein [Myxococcota bacterium]